jgi:hypothetical protein
MQEKLPPPKDFDINISNKPNIYSPQCLKTYKNVCYALIAQHGSALAAFRQHPEAQQNDEQTYYLENLVPHINALVEFNQDMSKSAREHRNRL